MFVDYFSPALYCRIDRCLSVCVMIFMIGNDRLFFAMIVIIGCIGKETLVVFWVSHTVPYHPLFLCFVDSLILICCCDDALIILKTQLLMVHLDFINSVVQVLIIKLRSTIACKLFVLTEKCLHFSFTPTICYFDC